MHVIWGGGYVPASRPIFSSSVLIWLNDALRVDTCQKRPMKEQKRPTDTGTPQVVKRDPLRSKRDLLTLAHLSVDKRVSFLHSMPSLRDPMTLATH
jgi:hypothetical protein